jgi:hypothetical protein
MLHEDMDSVIELCDPNCMSMHSRIRSTRSLIFSMISGVVAFVVRNIR